MLLQPVVVADFEVVLVAEVVVVDEAVVEVEDEVAVVKTLTRNGFQ
jgi:hypothetical protein